MTSTISEVSSNCWKLHWRVGGKWLREHGHFLVYFPPPHPSLGWETPSQQGLHIGHPGCICTFMAWREDSGLVSVQHFSLTKFIASVQRWSKDELSGITMPLARPLTFCIHTKNKNQTEFSLRWTLLGHNALGFCTAEPCNESQGWC